MNWVSAALRHRQKFRRDYRAFIDHGARERQSGTGRLIHGSFRFVEPAVYLMALPGLLIMAVASRR